ncbi:non-canonical purine NTP pyrophosphatase [Candidatus Chloroploca asiatica]|uniref:non-canonical purine NTP pyrophosphatase n=1 Tax=Candidatus Chloroploca asiatica TaxID=1506545 RepID=UPI000BEAA0B6|nr:non-canonical purine NTP pyrophosphatase [Candidatus Chloroploca asiatica]
MTSVIARPRIRDVFLSQDKTLEVVFYTSNISKFLQARTVFEQNGLILRHFKSKSEPYSEDYSIGKRQLLHRAIKEIITSVGKTSLFFVEDTSLRINALSKDDVDFPGLSVKEWFAETSFNDLDRILKGKGNNRATTVKSDIALYVPDLSNPVYFYGYTEGSVADIPPNFAESIQYPWLTPNTFNGWFIPSGSSKRLGEMSFEESWSYDFRVRALVQLVDRLEEYAAILNLPPQSYSRRHVFQVTNQLPLFPAESQVLVVVGHTCAGKTTFGEHASQNHSFRFIEASSIVRMFKYESGDELLGMYDFAKKILSEKGNDIIARRIVQLFSSNLPTKMVIIGLRTIEEVEVVKKNFPNTRVVLIDSTEKTRFERYISRARPGYGASIKEFRLIDSQHDSFGLMRVAKDFADIRIENEGRLIDYMGRIDTILTQRNTDDTPGLSQFLHPRHTPDKSQLYRCLMALQEAGCPLTCEEIEEYTKSIGRIVRSNNANKVLKRVPELARRLESEGTKVRYEIVNAGRVYIRLMDKWASSSAK